MKLASKYYLEADQLIKEADDLFQSGLAKDFSDDHDTWENITKSQLNRVIQRKIKGTIDLNEYRRQLDTVRRLIHNQRSKYDDMYLQHRDDYPTIPDDETSDDDIEKLMHDPFTVENSVITMSEERKAEQHSGSPNSAEEQSSLLNLL